MPRFEITAPDGRKFEITAPEGASQAEVLAYAQANYQSVPTPERTLFGNAKELVKGVLPGAIGLVESAATGASALLPEDMEKAARGKISSVATAAKEPFKAAAGYEDAAGRRIGEGLGSIIPAVPLGLMGIPGAVAGIGIGLAAGAGEARTRAEQEGASAEQRSKATAMGTIPGGFDTAIDMALAALPGGVGKSLSMVRRALVSGGVEGATEAAQAIAQNAIAKGVYKPNQALLEGSGEEGAYGAGVGALASVLLDMAIPGRRGVKGAPPPAPKAEPGPQIAPEAPKGTQGALFSEAEMGERIPEVKEPVTQPTPAAPRGEQLGLGLDFQREYADIVKEREALKQEKQTAEIKARIKELSDQLMSLHENEVESIRAEKAQEAEARAKFPAIANAPEPAQQSLFPELEVIRPEQVETEEVAPKEPKLVGQTRLPLRDVQGDKEVNRNLTIPARPTEITMQDLEDIGVPMRTSKKWLEENVLGKTPAEIQVLVGNNPDLLLGKGSRAQILKYLTAPVPEGFKEEPSVAPITQTNKPKPITQPRRGQPSVGVSGQPAGANVVQPGAGVPTTPRAPAAPVGLGLAPTGQPAGKGAAPAGAAKPTLVDYQTAKSAYDAAEAAFDKAAANAEGLRAQYEAAGYNAPPELATKLAQAERARDQASRNAKAKFDAFQKLSAPTPPAPVTPAAPAAGPTVAAKPTPKAPVAKKVETPAPAKPTEAVETETAEEEAARKREAEEFKRRLEALEKKAEPRATATPTAKPEPKAEKAEPKELPEKLREPVGTSEYGMEEGEKEILRGPQGMLFPMSKREETEYAERKQRGEKETAEEPTKAQMTPRDARQGRLDLQPRKEIPENVQKVADRLKGTVAYHGADGSIIRSYDSRTGESIYIPVSANKADFFTSGLFGGALDIGSIRGDVTKVFTQKDFDALKAQVVKLKQQDAADAAKYPDGPFTGTKTNVVAGDSIDPRYTNYLTELMQSLGLGDVRVFLYHGKDVKNRGDELHLHGDYYPILSRAEPDKGQNGAAKPIGPTGKDFMLFVNDNMSEERTLEVIAHELGHMIQAISYNKAPANVKAAIKDEYNDWVDSLKGKKLADLVASLRNRYTVEEMEGKGITDVEIKKMGVGDLNYWMGFDEWFADNVSRWATTSDKPLSITEKFFSKVAQMMRDLVSLVTGRKFPPNKKVAEFIDAMGPGSADMWLATANPTGATKVQPLQNAVSYTTESLIDSMGPLSVDEKSGLRKLIDGVKATPEIDYVTKFRTQVTDIAATIEKRLSEKFDGAVRDSLGKLNPMGLYRQAQDYSKMLLEYFQTGTLYKDSATGLWKSGMGEGVRPPSEVYALIDKYAQKNGYSRERATQIASRVLEGVRLDAMRTSNKTNGTNFLLHLKDNEIDQLVREYNADPDLKEMSKLMDEARIAMVNNMVKAGRLSKEEGKTWSEVAGYVPFDRLEDFSTNFNKVKKVSGKGLAQVGKLPELVGSMNRPVGNVFDNYINTLGWMVGQTMKTDATVQTLRSLEDLGQANFLGRSAQGKPNVVGAYVDGEMMYWSVPSKYDVMAFKDLNPPKAGWLRNMGAFSNVLRKTVTVLPPFALKQVTDDVQRAILTSGVKNPGALVWMSLTNFPKLALAELRGIQHPVVKEFGRLGLTGEYDFEAGKPATSLLKDLGYKPRGKFEALMHRLDGITRASDLAVRKAIYDQTMKESQDAVLAQTRAREFINFRRRGASDFVGAMVTTIPFFNAYIQGMDVLYRAASGKDSSASVDRAQARRMFWSRAATVMALSSLYAMGKDDEDKDYQEMDLRTRDGNWILPGGYKIPVPGELGAIFKVIPERIVEYMRRQGTPEEQEAFEAVRTTLSYMFEQYLGRAVPVPQAIKPVMEAWANKSFLTGRDLEGYHHKAMDPSMRTTEQTSELAKAIAKFSRDEIGAEISPIMIDNTLRGYFGSSAAMLTMVTDSLLNPTRVDRPLHKYALLSNYLYDPVGTRRMTEFYEEREKVGKANTTLNELMKTDLDRAEKYAEAHAEELQLEGLVNSTLEQLERTRAYRKWLNSAEGAADMSKEEREAELKEIKQQELEFVGWVREAKAELRKAQ